MMIIRTQSTAINFTRHRVEFARRGLFIEEEEGHHHYLHYFHSLRRAEEEESVFCPGLLDRASSESTNPFSRSRSDFGNTVVAMQLYHHPYSLESQKVRLALEEKTVDYTSFHVNPLTGKNMGSFFFRMNPSGKLPVFQNGSHVLFRTIDIIQYIDRVVAVVGNTTRISEEALIWMEKIDGWDPKIFTLSHVPQKYRLFVSKFIRQVIIARMADSPDLASVYHVKLRDAYYTEEEMKNPNLLKHSIEKLTALLDDAEAQLNETTYLAGEDFTMADCMFVPVLARISLLDLEDEYINCRPKIFEYYKLVKSRPSYKVVIGKYFLGWRKYRTLLKTSFFLGIRRILKRY